MAQRKQMPGTGIRVAQLKLILTGMTPHCFVTLQLSGTVSHASMVNNNGDVVSVVCCSFARFSPDTSTHTMTSPHIDWAELIQLPSVV